MAALPARTYRFSERMLSPGEGSGLWTRSWATWFVIRAARSVRCRTAELPERQLQPPNGRTAQLQLQLPNGRITRITARISRIHSKHQRTPLSKSKTWPFVVEIL